MSLAPGMTPETMSAFFQKVSLKSTGCLGDESHIANQPTVHNTSTIKYNYNEK